MKTRWGSRVRITALSAVIMLMGAAAAQAATITVDTLADGSVMGHCTLRDAITAANTTTATNAFIAQGAAPTRLSSQPA